MKEAAFIKAGATHVRPLPQFHGHISNLSITGVPENSLFLFLSNDWIQTALDAAGIQEWATDESLETAREDFHLGHRHAVGAHDRLFNSSGAYLCSSFQ